MIIPESFSGILWSGDVATTILLADPSDDDDTDLGSVTRAGHDLNSPDPSVRDAGARQIYEHYARRLEWVFRRRLDRRILNAAGAEDLVQSLFADFFADPPASLGPPLRRADLWRILVRYAVCKAADAANYHLALCRNILRLQQLLENEGDASDSGQGAPGLPHRSQPTPDEQVAARIEFDWLLKKLSPELRQVLLLRLEGYSNAEIAQKIDRVERTVELKLKTTRPVLAPYLSGSRS